MMALFTAAAFVLSSLLAVPAIAQDQTCFSYGVDIQNGGSYFQNISSTDDFTFASIFEGCQADVANNILVDPNGDEYQCTDTNLTPDDTAQLSTCPLEKDQLWSGDWSVILISNNGDSGIPIAYERDFYMSVGVPVTTTFTPTVTVSATTTPIINSTITNTLTDTITAVVTTTVPSRTYSPTITTTPKKVTTTITKVAATVSKTARTVIVSVVTKTKTASCTVPKKQNTPDPTATITPTLVTAAALATDAAKAKFRRVRDAAVVPLDREQRIAERKAALALKRGGAIEKRTLDSATTTVTDMSTTDWPTTTVTSTAAASTLTITTQVDVSITTTSTSTVQSGKTTLAVVTITAPTPTLTKTKYTVLTTTVTTLTRTQTVTTTTTTVPSASASVCRIKGGRME